MRLLPVSMPAAALLASIAASSPVGADTIRETIDRHAKQIEAKMIAAA